MFSLYYTLQNTVALQSCLTPNEINKWKESILFGFFFFLLQIIIFFKVSKIILEFPLVAINIVLR